MFTTARGHYAREGKECALRVLVASAHPGRGCAIGLIQALQQTNELNPVSA